MTSIIERHNKLMLLIAVLLGVLASVPVQAARKLSPATFGMLGFSGSLEPGWSKKPVKIRFTKIPKDSPVEGKLKEGDVIVGFGNETFKMDPNPAMAFAIDDAERESGNKLTLLLKSGNYVKNWTKWIELVEKKDKLISLEPATRAGKQ